jgi:hypothetical protein
MIKSRAGAILFAFFVFCVTSCAVRKGCPSDGANVGAERILSGDPQAAKDIRNGKSYNIRKF